MRRWMVPVLIAVVSLSASVMSAQTSNIAGDWLGALQVGSTSLHLILHVVATATGYTGTIDSVDQGANGIPLSSITFDAGQLKLASDVVHATYEGKLSDDAKSIVGQWTQGQPIPLTFTRSATAVKTEHKAAPPSDIDGAWMGSLDTGAIKLRIVVHIHNAEDDLMATLDSPDQNVIGLPATVTRDGPALKLEIKAIGGVIEGKINSDLTTIDGSLSQRGANLPLVLNRVKDIATLERRRPQNPIKPYPYREEDVAYTNPSADISLAATLTIPPGKGPFPAVVLITGSGPQDRDESLLGHKPFLVLSDYLTRHGIAVLRADDRGIAKSGGTFTTATTADFATDTEAGIAFLQTRPEIDPHKIGLIGHSEGGLIAPMIAARNPSVAFIVMMAGPGVPGEQILPAQLQLISEAMGKSHAEAEKAANQEREVLALLKQEKDADALRKQVKLKLGAAVSDTELDAQLKTLSSPWFRYFVTYDPAPALEKVKCPVLALNGAKDLQVPPQLNLPAIRQALQAGGNKDFETDELPGLNHLFQTAKTGAPSEYGDIEETLSPIALDKITAWILKHS